MLTGNGSKKGSNSGTLDAAVTGLRFENSRLVLLLSNDREM